MSPNNATLFSGYDFDFLNNSTQLTGSHFKDPVLVSAIAVNGICALCFALLLIATWIMKRRKQSRLEFAALHGLLVAMFVFVSPIIHPTQACRGISVKDNH
jgi:hypothetical protein